MASMLKAMPNKCRPFNLKVTLTYTNKFDVPKMLYINTSNSGLVSSLYTHKRKNHYLILTNDVF